MDDTDDSGDSDFEDFSGQLDKKFTTVLSYNQIVKRGMDPEKYYKRMAWAAKLEKDGFDCLVEREPDMADQFGSCQPWKGAIKKPTTGPLVLNKEQPNHTYEIEFVHGFKSNMAYQNCLYNNKRQPVYMTAALGIILD